MPSPTDSLLREANEASREIARVEREAARTVARLKRARRAAWLRANRAGATYPAIVEACSISDGLLCKELRVARTETRTASLVQRPSQNPARRPAPRVRQSAQASA